MTIVYLLIRIFALAALGFFLKKKELIDEKMQQGLSKLLVSVFLPASILASSSNLFDSSMLNELKVTGIFSLLYFSICSFILVLILRKIPNKMSHDKQNVFLNLVIYGNTAFMGYPIIENLLGQQAMIIAVVFNIIWNIFFFTVGISLMKGQKSISLLSIIKNPATISSVATIIVYLSPFRFPVFINTFLTDVGGMVTPVSMILIGVMLSDISFKSLIRDGASILVALIRLLIIPILAILILRSIHVSELAYQTIIVMLAMPSASMVAIHASLFDKESEFATRSVSLNTALFALTFPLILFLTLL